MRRDADSGNQAPGGLVPPEPKFHGYWTESTWIGARGESNPEKDLPFPLLSGLSSSSICFK